MGCGLGPTRMLVYDLVSLIGVLWIPLDVEIYSMGSLWI